MYMVHDMSDSSVSSIRSIGSKGVILNDVDI